MGSLAKYKNKRQNKKGKLSFMNMHRSVVCSRITTKQVKNLGNKLYLDM